jgi:hypothetical protein
MNLAPLLAVSEPERLAPRRLRPLGFALHPQGGDGRAAAEQFVRERFASRHGARVEHFLPELLGVHGVRGLCAVVGLCPARSQRLFAEAYLDLPVEQAVSERIGQRVARADVVEIGNLASGWPGASLLLFLFLGEVLLRTGPRYAVFTASPRVEQLLARMHYEPTVLSPAAPARLPDGGASWGRYYDDAPRVLCGEIAPAVRRARESRGYRIAARALAAQVERVSAEYRARHASSGGVA